MKKLRSEINKIHKQIFKLLIKRVLVTQKIWEIKKQKNIKLTDLKREQEIIHMFDHHKKIKNNSELKKMVQKIQKTILTENIKYLKNENR